MPWTAHDLIKPFLQPVKTARTYNRTKLRQDLVAGLTVAAVEVPQAMAYALIAGVPPQYGIYTSIIQGCIGALLSSCEHMTTGPTNTQSLLIASAVARMVSPGDEALYLQLVIGLTLIKGVIQLACSLVRLGDLVRFVSHSVIVGVAAGAGVLIAAGQLPHLLGLQLAAEKTKWHGLAGAVDRMILHLDETNRRALMVGAGVIVLVVVCRRISRFVPGALIAVVGSAALVAHQGWTDSHLPLIGALPRGLPIPSWPRVSWEDVSTLFGGALALAILGMIESVAIAKTMASRSGEHIDPNQEFFAQGIKNILSSFFQCIPGSASFTRSALDYDAGAASRFAAVFNSIFVAVIFLCFADYARFIPLAALAGVLMVIAYGLIDWRYVIRVARTSPPDLAVCVTTLVATLTQPLEYAIFVGIFVSISLYLRQASHLHLNEISAGPGGTLIERPLLDSQGVGRVVFLQIEGDLFFGVADELDEKLDGLEHTGVRVVIIRLKRTHSIDATVLRVLERFTMRMQAHGGHVVLCGVKPDLLELIEQFGLAAIIGKENIFTVEPGAFTSAKHAMARARELAGGSINVAGVDLEESESWAFQI